MQKLISLLSIVAISLSLTNCGSSSGGGGPSNTVGFKFTAIGGEESELFTFNITLNKSLEEDITFKYKTKILEEDTAQEGDFVAILLTTGIIPAGETEYSIAVTINNDMEKDPNETFSLVISEIFPITALSPVDDTITLQGIINDDDSVTVDVILRGGGEESGSVIFDVSLDVIPDTATTFDYKVETVSEGAAAADFVSDTIPSGQVTIPARSTEESIEINIKNDDFSEGDETFNLILENLSSDAAFKDTVGDTKTVTGIILDNDLTILSVTSASGGEGDSNGNSVIFNMSILPARTSDFTFSYEVTVSGKVGAASQKDFPFDSLPSGTISVNALSESATIQIGIKNDTDREDIEEFNLLLSNLPEGVKFEDQDASISVFIGYIIDNNVELIISHVPGGGEEIENVEYRASLTEKLNTDRTFQYEVQYLAEGEGAAKAIDFQAGGISGSVVIPANKDNLIFSVAVTDDDKKEGVEAFNLLIKNVPSDLSIVNKILASKILDNDETPSDSNGNGLIEIYTAEQLNNMRYSLTGDGYKSGPTETKVSCTDCYGYELSNSINLDSISWEPIIGEEISDAYQDSTACTTAGGIWKSDACYVHTPFSADFYGNDYTILNLTIDKSSRYTGLIGLASGIISGVIIRGDSVVNSYTSGSSSAPNYTGALVGSLQEGGVVANSSASTSVTASGGSHNQVGGLVGGNSGIVRYSSASGDVRGSDGIDNVGGLVGNNSNIVEVSTANSTAFGNGNEDNVGGLVGNNSGTVQYNYAGGVANGNGGNDSVGGLVGKSSGIIRDNYAIGVANGGNGNDSVGGLVGSGSNIIGTSYAIGTVDGGEGTDNVGRFMGLDSSTTVEYNYYWISSPISNGTVRDESDATKTNGVTKILLLSLDTDDWSSNNWNLSQDFSYPSLKSQKGGVLCNQPDEWVQCDSIIFANSKPTEAEVSAWTLSSEIINTNRYYFAVGIGNNMFSNGTRITDYASGMINPLIPINPPDPPDPPDPPSSLRYLPPSAERGRGKLQNDDVMTLSVVDPDINNSDSVNYIALIRERDTQSYLYKSCDFRGITKSQIHEDVILFKDKSEITVRSGGSQNSLSFLFRAMPYRFIMVKVKKTSSNQISTIAKLLTSLKDAQGNKPSLECQTMSFNVSLSGALSEDDKKLTLGSGFLDSTKYDNVSLR